MPTYTKAVGDPAQGAVPPGQYNVLETLINEWLSITGFQTHMGNEELLELANAGVMTLRDLAQFAHRQWPGGDFTDVWAKMPWAKFGLSKDEYASASTIFGTTYKEMTGSEIPPEALDQAFQNPRDRTGGYLTGSQYKQQLFNDASIQKQYGWVKYGMDFSAWTQQKLTMRSAYGRDINDAEAATILQYHKAASGPNMGAVARASGQQEKPSPAGVAGSIAR
jgi:hypothetical protein